MTQSSCKRHTKSKSHPSVKLAPVRVFSCEHPLTHVNETRILSKRNLIAVYWLTANIKFIGIKKYHRFV